MDKILYILVDMDNTKAEACRFNQELNIGDVVTLKEFGDKKFHVVIKNSVVKEDISYAPIFTVDKVLDE